MDDAELPYSFSHPEGFGTGETDAGSAGGVGYQNQTVIAPKDGRDLVSVQTQKLNRRVTPKLLPRVKRELTQAARQAGSVRNNKSVKVAGIDGFQYRLELEGGGTTASAQWTYLPQGRTLYFINCQWEREREAVLDACREVLGSFEVDGKGKG